MKEALKILFTKANVKKMFKSAAKQEVKNIGEKIAGKVSNKVDNTVEDKLSDSLSSTTEILTKMIYDKLPDTLKPLFDKNKNVTIEYLNELIRSIDISEKMTNLGKDKFLKNALSLNFEELKKYNDANL